MKRKSSHIHLTSAEILNVLSVEDAQELLEGASKDVITTESDCVISTRYKFGAGHYPRIQIPLRIARKYDELGHLPKGQLKVGLHQLAFRADDRELPNYEEGYDIAHLCHNGRGKIVKGSLTGGCFNRTHLAIQDHAQNMAAQHCTASVQCTYCHQWTLSCTHTPQCQTKTPKGEEVVRVTVEYADGSTKVIHM